MFIRPYHKKQYREMLDGFVGQSTADAHPTYDDQEKKGKEHLTLL